jgi:hypothetical protein
MTDVLVARTAQAIAALSDDQREALIMRDRDGLSYAAIGEKVDRSVDGTAVLLVAARMSLRERVLGGDRIATSGEYCTHARAWLSAMEDGEDLEVDEIQWTRAHVRECETCTVARRALREACLAGRAWAAAGAPGPVNDGDDYEEDGDDFEDDEELEDAEEEPAEPGTDLERRDGPGVAMARYRGPSALELLRRRLTLAAGVVGAVLVLGALVFGGGGGQPAGRTAAPPSDGGVVPPPSQRFCAAGEPGC